MIVTISVFYCTLKSSINRNFKTFSSLNVYYSVEFGPRPTTTTTTAAPPSDPPGYLARFVNFASRSVNAVGSNLVGTGALLLAAASPLIVPAFAGTVLLAYSDTKFLELLMIL